jgi:hypothetical protein
MLLAERLAELAVYSEMLRHVSRELRATAQDVRHGTRFTRRRAAQERELARDLQTVGRFHRQQTLSFPNRIRPPSGEVAPLPSKPDTTYQLVCSAGLRLSELSFTGLPQRSVRATSN